jgi:tetratricopeptide (TPR) repeat protein
LKLNRAEEALEDGNQCCSIDAEWAKGWIRKGDALYALRRFTDSFNAYNSALRISPRDSSVQEKCETAQRAIRNETAQPPSGGQTAAGELQLPGKVHANANRFLTSIIMVAKVLVILSGIASLAPGIGSQSIFRVTLISALVSYSLSLYSTHGIPKFNMSYLERIVSDQTSVYLFLVILLFTSTPHLLALAPILMSETILVAHFVTKVLVTASPVTLATLETLIQPLVLRLVGETNASWSRFTPVQKWSSVVNRILLLSAWAEVLQLGMLVIALALPSRNFILIYLWSQYLRMRYMADTTGNMKSIFARMDQKVVAILAHPSVPAPARQAYSVVKEMIKKQVQPAQTAQPASGLGSCCIM